MSAKGESLSIVNRYKDGASLEVVREDANFINSDQKIARITAVPSDQDDAQHPTGLTISGARVRVSGTSNSGLHAPLGRVSIINGAVVDASGQDVASMYARDGVTVRNSTLVAFGQKKATKPGVVGVHGMLAVAYGPFADGPLAPTCVFDNSHVRLQRDSGTIVVNSDAPARISIERSSITDPTDSEAARIIDSSVGVEDSITWTISTLIERDEPDDDLPLIFESELAPFVEITPELRPAPAVLAVQAEAPAPLVASVAASARVTIPAGALPAGWPWPSPGSSRSSWEGDTRGATAQRLVIVTKSEMCVASGPVWGEKLHTSRL